MNILLVDDSPSTRSLIQHILQEHPKVKEFRFLLAENGEVALNILSNSSVDVIFLDWNMPIMDGEQLIYNIRNDKRNNHIKIILATAEGSKEKVLTMVKKGISAYLLKPLEKSSLTEAFNVALKQLNS